MDLSEHFQEVENEHLLACCHSDPALLNLFLLNHRRSLIRSAGLGNIQQSLQLLEHPLHNMRDVLDSHHLKQLQLLIALLFGTFLKESQLCEVASQIDLDQLDLG